MTKLSGIVITSAPRLAMKNGTLIFVSRIFIIGESIKPVIP